MTNDVPSGNRSVVLLQDATLRSSGGLTAWRESVHVTFTELGEDVHAIVREPLSDANSGTDNGVGNGADGGTQSGDVGGAHGRGRSGVSGAGARPVGRSFPERALRRAGRLGLRYGRAAARRVPGLTRAGRTALGRVTGRAASAGSPSKEPESPASTPRGRAELAVNPRLAELAAADLVLAETPEVALAAAAVGVAKARLWLLAVPIERAGPGEPVPWAEGLREAVPVVGGMLVDTLDAAGVIERVAAPEQVSVFPPIATDRAYAEETRAVAGQPLRTLNVFPDDLAGHLELWWSLLGLDPGEATAYSFPVARFRGETGPWREPALDPWGRPADRSVGELPEPWTAETQRAGLRRVLDLLPGRLRARNGGLKGAADSVGAGAGTDDGAHKVGVFGYDMKFFRELAARLDTREDLDVVVDEWPSAGRRNEGVTEPLARSAQTLVAEWARPNAVWLAQNKRPEQRLVVRLHRFEIETEHPRRLDIDAVDAVVTIAPLMGRRIRDELGWPVDKLVYVPNLVDVPRLDRPKYPDARFTLGMVSIVPGLKRFDLALDLLAAIRREDPRFTLLVRSATGWTHKPSWQLAEERHLVQRFTERIEKDPWLRGAVVFDAFGRDMATWYRKVGHMLSLSDLEGSHTALSEGMASGAVPVLRGWAGAEEVFGAHWVRPSLAAAVEEVLAAADPDMWRDRSARARADAAERFDPDGVVAAWEDLVRGRIEAARARFAAYADLDRTADP